MTTTPQKSFWPKRWIRSFAGTALATAVVGGAVWAADPPLEAFPPLLKELGKDTAKEAPKPAEPKVKELPKVAAPAVAKQKLLTFAMASKDWASVMAWYADESGLAFNSVEKPPTGTFNFIAPKDPKTGHPRQYTLSEITDIINESLLAKNYVLIRQETTFRLWPASEKVDPQLVRRVSLEDLKTVANLDLVEVVLPLKMLVASEQVTDVQRIMSKIGEVAALPGTNSLLMIEYAGNLKRIVGDLKSAEEGDQTSEQYTHKCEYVKARDAATHLKDLLGVEDTAAEGRGRGPGGPGGFGGQPFDPRMFQQGNFDPSAFGGGGGGRGRGLGGRTQKQTKVVADDATNTVFVVGAPDKVAQGKSFLVKFDVGTVKVIPGTPEFQTYAVPQGNAEAFAQALAQQYRGTSIRVQALSGSQIIVWATPADHLDIIKTINNLGKSGKEVAKNINVSGVDVNDVVTMLGKMFPDPTRGGPVITVSISGTAITVKGKQEQIADVESIIKTLTGGADGDAGSPSGNVRILNLKEGSATDLGEAVRMLMESMGNNNVKLIRPDGSPVSPPPKPPTAIPPGTPPFAPKGDMPKVPNLEIPKIPKLDQKRGAVDPGENKGYGYGVRDLAVTSMIAMGGGQIVDPSAAKPKAAGGAALTITTVGDRLIITGDDPKAVALAYELAQMIVKGKGESYKVFRLNNSNASEVARVLNEWFNPQQQQNPQQNRNPFAAFIGGRGGFGQQPPPAEPEKPRVRIVAEQSSNSLLVRANTLDLITIQGLLDKVLDVGPGDSKAVMKPFFIGPLQFAVATEVVDILKEVYRESTNQAASQSPTTGGFAAFAGPFGRGAFGQRAQPLDALGRPMQVSLSITADDRTNCIVGMATELMAKDIEKVVQILEKNAQDSTKVIQLVKTQGVDPTMVQDVLDAIQGRTPTSQLQQQGGGRGGFGQFGGGQGGFGGGRGGFGGGFGGPGGGFGGGGRGGFGGAGGGGRGGFGGAGGGGRGGAGGGRGGAGGRPGGRSDRPPGGLPGIPEVGRGPDFFEQGDMDVPQQTLLYDPYEEAMSHRRAGPLVQASGVQVLSPVRLTAGIEDEQPPKGGAAQPKPPVKPSPSMVFPSTPPKAGEAPKAANPFELTGPRGSVQFTPLTEFNAGVVIANNQADLQLTLAIIEQLRKYLEADAATSGPKLVIVPLKFGDAAEITSTVNQLGSRALTGQSQARTTPGLPGFGGAFGANQAQTSAGGSVLLLPIPRQNAILMFGAELRFPYYKALIEQFDVKNTNLPVSIPLKNASAQQVANLLTQFYATRYSPSGETQTSDLLRFTYSTSNNSIIVQAGKADLEEIKGIIDRLDTVSTATNQLKIIHLHNAPADELAATLQTALLANILPQGTGVVQTTGIGGAPAAPVGGNNLGGQQFGQALGGQNAANRVGTIGSQATNTTKTVSLRFIGPGKDGAYESGYLEDVHITADLRSNTLVISAREETQKLLAAVIAQLDQPSAARAGINIFTLKRADATMTANLLQQLFLGSGTTGANRGGAAGGFQAGGFAGANTTGNGATGRPLLTLTGTPGDSAALITPSITIDDRTNSVIVAASQNDLDAIRAIIYRLEDANVVKRSTHVIKLRNAGAVDVANALQPFLTNVLTVINTNITATNFLDIQRSIVVAAEPVSNNLLIDCTPEAMASLLPVIERLDAQPLQVSVEVLIAEVILTNNEEFGIEIGLQSPILFSRSVIPTNGGTSFSNATGGTAVPPGVTANSTIANYAGQAFAFNSTAAPAYSNLIQQGAVGFQGLTNYGVGRASTNGVGGFVFSAASDTLNVLIRALKTQGRTDNLTRPTITLLDNQIGSVNIGGLYPYTNGGQFTSFGTFQPTIAQQQIGTTLTVVPRISPDGRVLMRVEPSIIAPEDTLVSLGNGQFATAFRQQAVQTTVSVMDGETVVLGGLISKTDVRLENKVPWLGDLPYIGAAFRYRTQTQEKRELICILTPRVIRNCLDSERLLMEEARKMSLKLRDVNAICNGCEKLVNGPDAAGGSDTLPTPIHPPGAWVQPNGGAPFPLSTPLPVPESITPTPGKVTDPMLPPPAKPPVPALPKAPPVPEKPTAMPTVMPGSVMPTSYEPAGGIVMPGERR